MFKHSLVLAVIIFEKSLKIGIVNHTLTAKEALVLNVLNILNLWKIGLSDSTKFSLKIEWKRFKILEENTQITTL